VESTQAEFVVHAHWRILSIVAITIIHFQLPSGIQAHLRRISLLSSPTPPPSHTPSPPPTISLPHLICHWPAHKCPPSYGSLLMVILNSGEDNDELILPWYIQEIRCFIGQQHWQQLKGLNHDQRDT